MESYAVIQTGGKQYRVQQGDKLETELMDAEVGTNVEINDVLAVSDGSTLTVGKPLVEGAVVTLKVLDQFRGPKLIAFKKKRRKGYARKVGHRQSLTKVEVASIRTA